MYGTADSTWVGIETIIVEKTTVSAAWFWWQSTSCHQILYWNHSPSLSLSFIHFRTWEKSLCQVGSATPGHNKYCFLCPKAAVLCGIPETWNISLDSWKAVIFLPCLRTLNLSCTRHRPHEALQPLVAPQLIFQARSSHTLRFLGCSHFWDTCTSHSLCMSFTRIWKFGFHSANGLFCSV